VPKRTPTLQEEIRIAREDARELMATDEQVRSEGLPRIRLRRRGAPLLASTHFDAVLVDLTMPDTDGRDFATEIRRGHGLNTTSTSPKSRSIARPGLGSSIRERRSDFRS